MIVGKGKKKPTVIARIAVTFTTRNHKYLSIKLHLLQMC